MVDKALFIGTGGAEGAMHHLQLITNNLANIGTTGFRADMETHKQVVLNVPGQQTRVYSEADQTYSDFKPGPIISTGRDLDVAIAGNGFIAVQGQEGKEAYTRAGNLQIKNNLLTTQSGEVLFGSSGVVNLPRQTEKVVIGQDGTVTAKIMGQADPVVVDRIKLTDPSLADLKKGTDGLFYLSGDSSKARQSDKVRLTPGALEGSNVNAVETLTDLIELSRNFEFHTNLMKRLEDNAALANRLLELPK